MVRKPQGPAGPSGGRRLRPRFGIEDRFRLVYRATGPCLCVLEGDLTNRNYFYYAFSADNQWEGKKYFHYVDPQNNFSYNAFDKTAVSNVKQQGYERHGFNLIDTGGAPYCLVPLQ